MEDVSYDSDQSLFKYKGSYDIPENVAEQIAERIDRKRSKGKSIQFWYDVPDAPAGHGIKRKAWEQVSGPDTPTPPGPEGDIDYNYEQEKDYAETTSRADNIRTLVELPLPFALERISAIRGQAWADVERYLSPIKEVSEEGGMYRDKNTGQFLSKDDPRARPLNMNSFYLEAKFRTEEIGVRVIRTSMHGPRMRPGETLGRRTWNTAWEEMKKKIRDRLSANQSMTKDTVWVYVETRYREKSEKFFKEKGSENNGVNYRIDIP